MQMWITIGSFLFFTGLVAVLTWLITRNDDHETSSGYFLAGRSLTFPLIAGSLLLTNLSTEQMVGLNGAAFADGLCVMVWEVVCVVALVFMAWFFLPRFLKSGVATVPEYLEIRFDHQTQVITNIIFLVAYVGILLPIILYTGATGMMGILDVPAMLGAGRQCECRCRNIFTLGDCDCCRGSGLDLRVIWRAANCCCFRHIKRSWPVRWRIHDCRVCSGATGR